MGERVKREGGDFNMLLTAGEVARRLGLSRDALRYWERQGAQFIRDSSGRRLMTEADVDRLRRMRARSPRVRKREGATGE